MTDTPNAEIDLLKSLIERRSVTPDDAGCQTIFIERLNALGFTCETLTFGDVTNLWAVRGTEGPMLCFAGHTDVVPPGDEAAWATPPFSPTEVDDCIFGRGAADMKSGLAAMLVAIEEFVTAQPNHQGRIAMLITSDEEGRARDGTLQVMRTLVEQKVAIDWCVIGEPSSQSRVGDLIRIGRRGSLSGQVTVSGIQGHVAYPQLADNPIRRFAPLLNALHDIEWDGGNEYFPPTSFQVVDIRSGTGASNVTPAELVARFNFRYSTEWHYTELQTRVEELFSTYDLKYSIDWHLSGEPFLTQPGALIDAVVAAIEDRTNQRPELSTGGGTSDGRFIAPAGVDVVELGPVNASIHKVNEHVRIDDVTTLKLLYVDVLDRLLGTD